MGKTIITSAVVLCFAAAVLCALALPLIGLAFIVLSGFMAVM